MTCFFRREIDYFLPVRRAVENTAIASDDRSDEEAACEITEESNGPMDEHFDKTQAALQDCNGGELHGEQGKDKSQWAGAHHEAASAEIGASENDPLFQQYSQRGCFRMTG